MKLCPRTRSSGAAGIRNTAPKRWRSSNALNGGRSAVTSSADTLKGFFDRTRISKTLQFTAQRRGVDYLLALAGGFIDVDRSRKTGAHSNWRGSRRHQDRSEEHTSELQSRFDI